MTKTQKYHKTNENRSFDGVMMMMMLVTVTKIRENLLYYIRVDESRNLAE